MLYHHFWVFIAFWQDIVILRIIIHAVPPNGSSFEVQFLSIHDILSDMKECDNLILWGQKSMNNTGEICIIVSLDIYIMR